MESLLISQFLCLLDAGVPDNSSAQVRWAKDGIRLSVLAELQAGAEHLKAEFNGGKTEHVIPRWEYFSRLQHQVKALLKRGVSSSIQAKAHYKVFVHLQQVLFFKRAFVIILICMFYFPL